MHDIRLSWQGQSSLQTSRTTERFCRALSHLSVSKSSKRRNLFEIVVVIQRMKWCASGRQIERYICELGTEDAS